MDLETCEWEWFTPSFQGNRESETPMAIEVRRPTLGWIHRELEVLDLIPDVAKLSPLEKAKRVMEDERLFCGNTRAVRGLLLRGHSISTGEQLWSARDEIDAQYGPFFREIVAAIQARLELDAATKKNSPSPSGSPDSPLTIDGIVEPVGVALISG